MLSEHQCEGWLEGYLLTGRHGLFNCYEAFIHIVDSMFNQHAKWLKVTARIAVAAEDRVAELSAGLPCLAAGAQRIYPPGPWLHRSRGEQEGVDRSRLSSAGCELPAFGMDHCLRSRHYVNVVIAGKYPALQWLNMDAAVEHCTKGIGIWEWASNDKGAEPDVVMACCGDVPTLETLAAVSILREHRARTENTRSQRCGPDETRAQQRTSARFKRCGFRCFVHQGKPIIFAFHGYPWLIHRLTYRRTNHHNLHVRGYKEEGTITTTFLHDTF